MEDCDVVIVGGGPAGLSAALVLGRCRRKVVLYDDDRPRNAPSTGVHGFLGRDGIAPAALRAIGHEELAPYDVTIRQTHVVGARRTDQGFVVTDAEGSEQRGRRLLLATGVRDRIPDVVGARELYGRGVYPCAYCDGWDHRERALGAYGGGEGCADFALSLKAWSQDVTLFCEGTMPPADELAHLSRHGVRVVRESVVAFEADASARRLRHVRLSDGRTLPCDAVFLHLGQEPRSPLAEMLGCALEGPGVETLAKQRATVPGLYLAGDLSQDVKFAVVAAGHGARAAHDIHRSLRLEDTP